MTDTHEILKIMPYVVIPIATACLFAWLLMREITKEREKETPVITKQHRKLFKHLL